MESGLGSGSNDISETYANEKQSLKFLIFLALLTLASVSAVACGSPSTDKSGLPAAVGTTVAATPTTEESVSPTSTGVPPTTVDPTVAVVTPTPEATPEYDFSGLEESERSRAERLRLFWNWNTDFNHSTI